MNLKKEDVLLKSEIQPGWYFESKLYTTVSSYAFCSFCFANCLAFAIRNICTGYVSALY